MYQPLHRMFHFLVQFIYRLWVIYIVVNKSVANSLFISLWENNQSSQRSPQSNDPFINPLSAFTFHDRPRTVTL